MSQMRLDKFLAQNGFGTRSEVKKLFKAGQVLVNGVPEKKSERKIDPDADMIVCCGKTIQWKQFVCLMFHKPAGCITATEDKNQKTVMDYISHDRKAELFPVGRLDIDTEGLLFMMNDGDLAHRMLSPRHHVEKTYFVRTDGEVTMEDAEAFEKGVDIGEKNVTMPAKLKILQSGPISESELTICEGKFHQVKRMFSVRGKEVVYLKRISMAGLDLDPSLAPGEWRELNAEETERLLSSC